MRNYLICKCKKGNLGVQINVALCMHYGSVVLLRHVSEVTKIGDISKEFLTELYTPTNALLYTIKY